MQHERAQFDSLEPPAALWTAIETQLASAPDALQSWTQHHRAAFDVRASRTDQWPAISRALDRVAPAPQLTASRGGAHPTDRPTWWRLAAAAVMVFGLGYGLRVGTEPIATDLTAVAGATQAADGADVELHVVAPRHGFRNQEPDPAVQAAVLASNVQSDGDLTTEPSTSTRSGRVPHAARAPEIARLEARYAALVARQRAAAQHRFVPTPALADEWDREMTILDSAYAALRQELPRNRRPDEVVAAMNRNLYLRLKLLHQQMMALDAVQDARQRAAGHAVPRRPPSVNPDDNGVNPEDAGGGTLVPPAPPALDPLPGLGAQARPRPRWTV